jgi:hypothetical protein
VHRGGVKHQFEPLIDAGHRQGHFSAHGASPRTPPVAARQAIFCDRGTAAQHAQR